MSNIDKRALREVAEKATPGYWHRASSRFNGITVTPFSLCDEEVMLAHAVEKRDAEFIAAANPATMLALLDENLQLQREKDATEAVALALRDDMRQAREQLAALEREQERRQADSAEPACYALTNMAGEVYNTHSSAQNAGAYRDLIHQSDDSLTLRVTPLYAVPPASVTGIYDDVLNIIGLLENNEWAEHCTSTVLGSLLESEITRLVSKEQSAPVVPEEITDESTEQRLMGRRWAHSFCAGWNACRAAMLNGGKS